MRRVVFTLGLLLALSALACGGDDTTAPPDGGSEDSGVITVPDAGTPDAEVRPDAGIEDTGPSDPDLVLEGKMEIVGLRFFVKVMGTTTSTMPPAIVLHTGPGTAHEYLPDLMRFMLPGRTVVYYDQRASGQTSFAGSTSSTITMSQDIIDLDWIVGWTRNLVGKSGPVDLIGHGWGGGIAALYAAEHPENVSRLVLITPFPMKVTQLTRLRIQEQNRFDQQDREFFMRLMSPECVRDINNCYMQFWRRTGRHMMCRENADLFGELFFRYGDFRARGFREQALRDGRYDWSDQLSQVSAPTTIIAGGFSVEPWVAGDPPLCDLIPTETATTYQALIPNVDFHEIDNAGHFPMIEQAAEFQRIIKEALTYP